MNEKITKRQWNRQRFLTHTGNHSHAGADYVLHMDEQPYVGRIPQSDTKGHGARPSWIDNALDDYYHPFPSR
jgi:hypothetical protein